MQTRTDASFALIRTLVSRALERARKHARSWSESIGHPYRPEKHYMRGPGPKGREKAAHAGGQRRSDAS